LNFAVPELPLNAFRETYHVSQASNDDDKGGGTNVSEDATSTTSVALKKARRKKDPITKKKAVDEDKNNAQKQLADAMLAFHQTQSEKAKSNRKSAAPHREQFVTSIL